MSTTGANDATNPAQYQLQGGANTNTVIAAAAVVADPQAITLSLGGPLAPGNWVLIVSTNVKETGGTFLQAPTAAAFTVGALTLSTPVNEGAENDDDEDVLRKHLNPALRGRGWDALIAGLATGDATNRENARTAYDQLFLSTSSGIYLQRHAADIGLAKPANIGLPDPLFRQYAIKTNASKLVEPALLEILEVFYGPDSTRARTDTAEAEPYPIRTGDTLTILIDEQVICTTVFDDNDFAVAGQARAIEVAAVLTRNFRFVGSNAYALPITNPDTGLTTVRIYSGKLGLGSALRVTGGSAQNLLQFDTLLDTWSSFNAPTWVVSQNLLQGTTRFTRTGTGEVPALDLVRVGDYANIFGTEFNALNRGSFTVTAVSFTVSGSTVTEYFEVANAVGVAETVTQVVEPSLLFFRPVKKTVYGNGTRAVIAASLSDGVDFLLPATSQAVGRGLYRAAYAQANASIAVATLERVNGTVSVTTAAPHGLAVGNQVFIDGVYGSVAIPTTTPGTYTSPTATGTADTCKASVWSGTAGTANVAGAGNVAVRLLDGRVWHGFGYQLAAGIPTDTITHWSVLEVVSESAQPDGTVQVQFKEQDNGGTTPARSYVGASLGTSVNWYYGQVLVTGGSGYAGSAPTTAVGSFNPALGGSPGTYSTLSVVLNTARTGHAQVTISASGHAQDGGFFVCGGWTGSAVTSSCERYSAVEGVGATAFAAMASMGTARCQHQAVVLANGKILVMGGRTLATGTFYWGTDKTQIGPLLNSCEVYDPVANTWTATGSMTWARYRHQAKLLPDGRVLVFGGLGYDPTQPATPAAVTDAEVYDPGTGLWGPCGRLTWPRESCTGTYVPDKNQIVVVGGSDGVGALKTEIFDVATKTWRIGVASFPAPRLTAASALVGTDVVAVVGGYHPGFGATGATLNLYIPNADRVLGGGLNGLFSVTAVGSSTTFQYQTQEQAYTINASPVATVTAAAAQASSIPGPYILDPDGGVAITSASSTLSTPVNANQRYASVNVADATLFPDAPGWLCFDFGYANQVAPVKYFGRLSTTTLSIDASFKFPVTVSAGATVTLLAQKGPYNPDDAPDLGGLYLTDSPAGRAAAQAALAASVAAGIPTTTTIAYPGDRGLGGEGQPTHGQNKLSDIVWVFAGEDPDAEIAAARED